MKITAFLGSPRKGGNSERLLEQAIKGTGAEVRVHRLNDMKLMPCQNCGGCNKSGICIIEDEMASIYEDIRASDRLILASPVFFMSVSAQSKILIDRCQAFWCEKYLLNRDIPAGPHGRRGLVMLVGGMEKEKGIKCASSVATAFMRTVSVPEHQTLMYMGVDEKGGIDKHPSALTEALDAGKALIG